MDLVFFLAAHNGLHEVSGVALAKLYSNSLLATFNNHLLMANDSFNVHGRHRMHSELENNNSAGSIFEMSMHHDKSVDSGETVGAGMMPRAKRKSGWGLATTPATGDEPHTVNAVKVREDWLKWEAAISDELERLEKMGMWELTEKPAGTNVISSKWVFKIKRNNTGAISKYKARLVAQGFSQIPGIDFTDTFAPVAKLLSVRLVVALAAHFNYELHQMDVKNVYLNGDLKEEIYMKQPPGFPAPGQENKVCHLFKPIYELKQVEHHWYKKLCTAFLDMGFR
ncbi:hypothetical protein EWM64_g4598 [Hericium alpestre]|uniref:Reverse transcriptase Ty1/copia-type domain-containing protein n=1 Tax=Hericium alpestre TaxID=135208 RepID=A0A4Y9ZX10_9AGAM|nr:hypothetical protein EWM64_g4598 [Hericium alpestre]